MRRSDAVRAKRRFVCLLHVGDVAEDSFFLCTRRLITVPVPELVVESLVDTVTAVAGDSNWRGRVRMHPFVHCFNIHCRCVSCLVSRRVIAVYYPLRFTILIVGLGHHEHLERMLCDQERGYLYVVMRGDGKRKAAQHQGSGMVTKIQRSNIQNDNPLDQHTMVVFCRVRGPHFLKTFKSI
jgi:hypothetical protein